MKQASDATQAADQGQSRTRGRHIHRKGQLMTTSFQLQSTVRASGQLEITLQSVPPPEPGEDDVLISVEATPINPSDLGLLFAGADLSQARNIQRDGATLLSAPIEPAQLAKLGARLDKPLPVGNEGAGKVIRAGTQPRHCSEKRSRCWEVRCTHSIAAFRQQVVWSFPKASQHAKAHRAS
jgi:hypothetical protein